MFLFACIFKGEHMKIAMIIAPEGFRDEEFFVPYNHFLEKGYHVDVFSTKTGIAHGMLGGTFDVKHSVDELDIHNYDALVFAGGTGTPIVRSNTRVLDVVKEAYNLHKVIGAICWSPTVLAKSGILEGKNVTVWFGNDPEYNMTTAEVLEKYGAHYVNEPVVVDGNIITANGPKHAKEFAIAIDEVLNK